MRQHGRMEGLTFSTAMEGCWCPGRTIFWGWPANGFGHLGAAQATQAARELEAGRGVVNRVLPGDGEGARFC